MSNSPSYIQRVMHSIYEADFSSEDHAWVEKIERIRTELESSTAQVTFIDYGARLPDSQLSPEEMYDGELVSAGIGEICRISSKSRQWCGLLFKLVRGLRPLICLELGTCLGISTSYQASALLLNGCGRIITLEGAKPLADLAYKNLQKLHLTDNLEIITGRFQDNLEAVAAQYGPLDFILIDGHHNQDATLSYFQVLLPYVSEQAVLVFDDISWSAGMRCAWEQIRQNDGIDLAIDLDVMGLCIVDCFSRDR